MKDLAPVQQLVIVGGYHVGESACRSGRIERGSVILLDRKRHPNYRNVSSIHKSAHLEIEISAVNNWSVYVVGLIVILSAFVSGCWIFASGLFRAQTISEMLTRALYFLPLVAFLLLWFLVGLRIMLRRLCAIELFVGSEVFRWKYRILRWSKVIESRPQDITAVIVNARWYGNSLAVTMNGTDYSLDGLLGEDMELVARELRAALPSVKYFSRIRR